MTDYKKICLNCKWWRIYMQNFLFTKGKCDLGCGGTLVDQNFVCGKFEPAQPFESEKD